MRKISLLKPLLAAFLCAFMFASCQESREEHIARLVEEWSGREIRFPDRPVFTVQGRDTVPAPAMNVPHKVLVYVDSVGCMSCRLQLPKWKELMATVDSLLPGQVSFCFFLYPKDVKEMRYILRRDAFRHPVCIDTENVLGRLNGFPGEDTFQTFLLDKDNHVVAIGNPVHNPKVRDLYFSLMTGRDMSHKNEALTTVHPDSVVMLGDFPWREEKVDSLFITNTGSRPFVVYDITTNCGCLQARFPKEPALPGKRMKLDVVYRADHPGLVDKALNVYGNMEGGMIKIRVKGEAVK